jgi:1-acyl-sn-glycerol-3-phosphate acyltransferase
MTKNKENALIRWVLHTYVKALVKLRFHDLVFAPVDIDPNKSILLIANHFSYWDSLIMFVVNQRLLRKKFHVMAKEDTEAPLWFVKHGGVFTVKRGSRDMLKSLDYAAALLNDPQNMVLLFPQGKLHANFVERVNFEKGVMRIIDAAGDKCQIIFAATFVQYLQHKRPTATIYLQTVPTGPLTFEQLESSYQKFFDDNKAKQTEIVL